MKTKVQKKYKKIANVQNIQGEGLEIHYKRMSDEHQISALKNILSNWPFTGKGRISPSR